MDGDVPGGPWDDHADDDSSDESDRIRGWIPPDDRLWRHPSEAGPAPAAMPPRATGGIRLAGQRGRSGAWVVGGTSVCVLLALIATGLVVVTTDTGNSPSPTSGLAALTRAPTTEPGTGRVQSHLAAVVAAVRPSTVAIVVDKPGGATMVTGLVAEAGGIIVTAAPALTGARTITVVEPDGSRQVAGVIGVDETSGLAVVRIGDDLPAASFDQNDPSPGDVTLALAMERGAGSKHDPAPHLYAGTVVSSGRPLASGASDAQFAPTTVASPLTDRDLGSPMLDPSGNVSGLLAQVDGNGSGATSVFLPSAVVLGVALQLVSSGTVEHGWLGVEGADDDLATTTTTLTTTSDASSQGVDGAPVVAIEDDSPAGASGLEPGDLVIALDGHQVHSMAELWSRLYSQPPGTVLDVTFERAGNVESTTVVLGSASSDAQGDGTSP